MKYNHRLFTVTIKFVNPFKYLKDYYKPQIWGVLDAWYRWEGPSMDQPVKKIQPVSSITFRWMFILISVTINHERERYYRNSPSLLECIEYEFLVNTEKYPKGYINLARNALRRAESRYKTLYTEKDADRLNRN